jgi:hypothetical protein
MSKILQETNTFLETLDSIAFFKSLFLVILQLLLLATYFSLLYVFLPLSVAGKILSVFAALLD